MPNDDRPNPNLPPRAITHEVFVEPAAFAVALPDEHVVLCHEVLGQAGLRVHRIHNVPLACEKITLHLPRIVVASAALPTSDLDMIEDRTVAVGAVLVFLESHKQYDAIERTLQTGLGVVRERFGRRPG